MEENSTEEETAITSSLTWEILPWLRSITSLPILLKGILTAEDARLALEYGAAGMIVSNHGGRQLDSVVAGGEIGVYHVLQLLRAELELSMALAGCPTPGSITRSLVR